MYGSLDFTQKELGPGYTVDLSKAQLKTPQDAVESRLFQKCGRAAKGANICMPRKEHSSSQEDCRPDQICTRHSSRHAIIIGP